MINIVHVGAYAREIADGVAKTLTGLVDNMPNEIINVQIWQFKGGIKRINSYLNNSIRIIELPCFSNRFISTFVLPQKTKEFIKNEARHIDVFHIHSVFIPENIWISKLNKPYVLTPNGGYNRMVINGRNKIIKAVWLKYFELPYIKRAAKIHAVSPTEYNYLKTSYNKSVEFIPNGVSKILLKENIYTEGIHEDFVFIGRFEIYKKGLDLFLEGYKFLFDLYKENTPQIKLIGPDYKNGLSKIKLLIKRLGLHEKVEIIGPKFGEEKINYLKKAKIFIHTSRSEGMPFSVIEALALGIPVFITPGTNLAQYIQKYNAGWVVQPTPNDIFEGLKNVLSSSENEVSEKSKNAQKLVSQNFLWENIIEKMTNLYMSVIDN
jgi:glycosyltransferase involved in cell wall biosynthesis